MANTYDKLGTYTCGATDASIIFTGIPATYTDLVIRFSGQEPGTSGNYALGWIGFNGDTSGTNYARMWNYGIGATPQDAFAATGNSVGYGLFVPTRENTYGTTPYRTSNQHIYISNYASSFNPKSANIVGGSIDAWTTIWQQTYIAGISWSSASAITSIALYAPGTYWGIYTTADLYGIKNT